MATILAIGIATIDIINQVAAYPVEDSEVRALSQRIVRGGNATNTLVVLSQLGHHCHWGGVFIDEPDSAIINQELAQFNIDISACQRPSSGKMPTSYITVNQQSASRTIVHYRDCAEFSFSDFSQIDCSQFDWVHFEGRNIPETQLMLEYLQQHYPNLRCSLEIEKARPDIEALFPLASILMFSRDYALAHHYHDPITLLNALPDNTLATCTWGEQGAWAIDHERQILHSPPFIPKQIVDTLGAGDTFNAALIDQLVNNMTLSKALNYACRLAGDKCGQQGLTNLQSSQLND